MARRQAIRQDRGEEMKFTRDQKTRIFESQTEMDMQKEIDSLRAQLAQRDEKIKELEALVTLQHVGVQASLAREHRDSEIFKALEGAVEYYADPFRWQFMEMEETEDYEKLLEPRPRITGGKRAREAKSAVAKLRKEGV